MREVFVKIIPKHILALDCKASLYFIIHLRESLQEVKK